MLKVIKDKLSLLFFQNQNYILYNLFNKTYKIFKCKNAILSKTILDFKKKGYAKSKKISENEIDKINSLLSQSKKKYTDNLTYLVTVSNCCQCNHQIIH